MLAWLLAIVVIVFIAHERILMNLDAAVCAVG